MQTKRFEPYLKDFILLSQTSFNTNEITYLHIPFEDFTAKSILCNKTFFKQFNNSFESSEI